MFDRAKEGSNGFVLFLFPSHVRLIRNAAGEAWGAGKRESVLIRSHSGLDDRFLSFITRNRAKPTLGYVQTVFFSTAPCCGFRLTVIWIRRSGA